MKVILTGSTGFIGHEVLKQCLENPSITSIVALSRRDLPSSVTSNPKLKVTIINDFLSYSDPILEDIRGAKACIWYFQPHEYAEYIANYLANTCNRSLGKAYMPDNEMARKVSIDYTLAAVRAFDQLLTPEKWGGDKFRFVYCSGAASERNQTKPLWFAQEYRRIRVRCYSLFPIKSPQLPFSEANQLKRDKLRMSLSHFPRSIRARLKRTSCARRWCYPEKQI